MAPNIVQPKKHTNPFKLNFEIKLYRNNDEEDEPSKHGIMSTIYVGKKLTKNTDLHYDMDMDFNFHDHHINTTN